MPASLPLRGDEADLFARHHAALHSRVTRWVKTSPANIDDACSIAWLRLLRCQPSRDTALSWLTTVAIREAVRLHRRHGRVRYGQTRAVANEYVVNPELQRDALDGLEALASLPDRQRRLAELQAAGFTYGEIARLSRVADVASVKAAVVSVDDMSSTRVNAVYRFECVSGGDLVDGVALAGRALRGAPRVGRADWVADPT